MAKHMESQVLSTSHTSYITVGKSLRSISGLSVLIRNWKC